MDEMNQQSNILIYQIEDGKTKLDVKLKISLIKTQLSRIT
jgi:hypothetical protein